MLLAALLAVLVFGVGGKENPKLMFWFIVTHICVFLTILVAGNASSAGAAAVPITAV